MTSQNALELLIRIDARLFRFAVQAQAQDSEFVSINVARLLVKRAFDSAYAYEHAPDSMIVAREMANDREFYSRIKEINGKL